MRGPATPPSTAKELNSGSATTCSGPLHSRDTSAVAGPLAAAPIASDSDSATKPPATEARARGAKSASMVPLNARQAEMWKKCSLRRCAEAATA
jgi:hypothetical protein